jgi:hypothetical protein
MFLDGSHHIHSFGISNRSKFRSKKALRSRRSIAKKNGQNGISGEVSVPFASRTM